MIWTTWKNLYENICAWHWAWESHTFIMNPPSDSCSDYIAQTSNSSLTNSSAPLLVFKSFNSDWNALSDTLRQTLSSGQFKAISYSKRYSPILAQGLGHWQYLRIVYGNKCCLATELNRIVMTAQDSILMRDAATGNVETIKDHGKKDPGSFSGDEWWH